VGFSCITLGVAFVSGTNFPLPQVNIFLWNNVPSFDLFRSPELWNPLIAIGMILVFAAIATDINVPKEGATSLESSRYRTNILRKAIPIAFSAIVLLQTIVIVFGANKYSALNLQTSSLSTAPNRSLQGFLSKHNGYILWLPVAPVETTDSAVSSRRLGLIATAPKLTTTNLSATQYSTSNTLLSTNSLAWLSLPPLDLNNLFRRRDIGYLAVDTSITAWSASSLLSERSDIIDRLRKLGYPIVYAGKNILVYKVDHSSLLDSNIALRSSSRPLFQITRLVGFRDFGAVANVDNYAFLSAHSAGLYRKIVPCSSAGITHCLEIGIRVGGAAVISRRATFEVNNGEVVSVKVKSRAGDRLSSSDGAQEEIVFLCNGGTYARTWVTPSPGFKVERLGFEYIGGTACLDPRVEVVLLSPGAVGVDSKEVSTSVVLVDASVSVSNPAVATSSMTNTYAAVHGQSWYTFDSQSKKLGHLLSTQQDSWSVALPREKSTRVIDLWTNYNPLWRMSCLNGGKVSHTILNGWANGFIVGPGPDTRCIVSFVPQGFFNIATVIARLVEITGILFIGILLLRRPWHRLVDTL
jgi:hypothetical protein